MKKHNVILLAIGVLTFFQSCKNTKANAQTQIEKEPKTIIVSMIKALEWQEDHPIFAVSPTDWTNGAYQIGITRAYDATKNQVFLAALKNVGYRNNWNTHNRFYHADDITVSYGYLYLEMNDPRKNYVDLKPTDTFIQNHLFEPNLWKDGTDKQEFKKILWWWCDALFMAPPVLTLYAKHTKDNKYLDEMHRYYMETYTLLYDKEEKLFARDMNYQWGVNKKDLKEENGKKIFWARGNGWVLGGLALILEDMPKDYQHRDFYVNLYKEMANKIKELQHEDGLWRTSLLSPESFDHGEVSGSGFYTFAMAWGINNGILEAKEYKPTVEKAWEALKKCQQENGMIGWVQNIGASPEPATINSWQNYGTGAYLLAGSEILKLR